MEESGRLPGGLSAWRGALVLLRAHLWYLWVPLVCGPLYVVGVTLAWGWLPALLLAMAFVGYLVAMPDPRPGVPVTEETQAGLAMLVADVVAATGFEPPERVWLVATPAITARATRRRRELHIGAPLLDGLAVAEVRALVAHELSVLSHRRPWLVTRLLAQWDDAIERTAVRHSTVLSPFATEVHRQADAVAIVAGGGADVGARALAVAEAMGDEYRAFLRRSTPPKQAFARRAIVDLDDGWRRVLANGVFATLRSDDVAQQHASLAAAVKALGEELTLGLAQPRVKVEPLDLRARKRMVRSALRIDRPQIVRWRTYQEASAWWAGRAADDAEKLRKDVARLLGRRPVDDVETAEVLLSRNAELLAEQLKVDPEELADPDDATTPVGEPPIAFGYLVEDHLLRRGWRLEHPAIRGILISPKGERLDSNTLVSGTYASPDLSALRTVLQRDERMETVDG